MFRSTLGFALALSAIALLPFDAGASSFKVLHVFSQSGDGNTPLAGLIMDAGGDLYGTTVFGGAHDRGTLFRIAPDGQEEIVYSFGVGDDAAWPDSELTADTAGNLYGASGIGGDYGRGTVFRVSPDGTEQVLYAFNPSGDGADPTGALVFDQTGNLFGTTDTGGVGRNCGASGCGTIFKLAPDGTETVLYRFTGDDDGNGPLGDLVLDPHGRLFGTTIAGGSARCHQQWGCGTAFRVDTDGTTKALFRFKRVAEGLIIRFRGSSPMRPVISTAPRGVAARAMERSSGLTGTAWRPCCMFSARSMARNRVAVCCATKTAICMGHECGGRQQSRYRVRTEAERRTRRTSQFLSEDSLPVRPPRHGCTGLSIRYDVVTGDQRQEDVQAETVSER